MKTGTATHTAGWHVLLCAVFCLCAILSSGYAQSITELKSRAEDGDVQAQLALAKAYDLGEGVPKDEEKAVQWWEKAAEHGNASAQVSLGGVYSLGAGVPKNYAAAVRWWKKAAEQGDVTAEGNLGTAYGLGMGVPKDEVESVRWHTKAAANGNAASQFSLGMFYLQGAGVPKDEAEGVKWLRKSAEQGNADGEFWLGAMYYSGTGVAKAQYNLGMAYRAGAGVEKDNAQAYFWIAIAASSLEQGFVKDYRDKVEAVLTPAQLADVQERIRKFEEAHPATQTASLNYLPSVPQAQQQTQTQDHSQDQQQARAPDQLKPVFLISNCVLKSGSVILSAFKEALKSSKKYELVPDLSDKGRMDVVITVKMVCVEDKGNVAVASVYG